MPKKPPYSPLIEPVFMTGVGFDFWKEYVIVNFQYPADLENFKGPQKQARFLVQADQMKGIGAKFIEAGELAATMEKPAGNA